MHPPPSTDTSTSTPLSLVGRKRTSPLPLEVNLRPKPSNTLIAQGYTISAGPALGHTPAFVLQPDEYTHVETELLHPWIDSKDIAEGAILPRGRRIIKMFDQQGALLDINQFPLLNKRLHSFHEVLSKRSIVRNGAPWYRPIQRYDPNKWKHPKILVPGIARVPRVALDHSGSIPSHGVYAIFSPSEQKLESLYRALSSGGLARALQGITPKIQSGYVRCYRHFLMMINLMI